MRDDFRVSLGQKLVAFREELLFQLDIVLNDPVVNDDDFAGAVAVRMRVFFSRAAMRGPAGVADAVDAIERRNANRFLEVAKLPWGAANFHLAVVPTTAMPAESYPRYSRRRRPSRIRRHNALRADISDNAAHRLFAPRSCQEGR